MHGGGGKGTFLRGRSKSSSPATGLLKASAGPEMALWRPSRGGGGGG